MIEFYTVPRCIWRMAEDNPEYRFKFSHGGYNMSIGSFFHRVGAAFKKLFGSSTWEKQAASAISYVAPLLETIVGLSAGSAAQAEVTSVVTTVQTDLATVAAVIDGGTVSDAHGAQVVINALTSVKSNLSGLLEVAAIKNSDKQAAITSAVNLIVGEVDAMLGSVPARATPTAPAPAPAKP